MANTRTNFNAKVIKEIILEIIKKIPLVDSSVEPKVEINLKNFVIDIKVAINDDNYGVYNCLSETQDLVYYELKEMFDNDQITVNVETL